MEIREKVQFFTAQPLFLNLQAQDVEHLANLAQHRKVPKFQFVYMPDEVSDQVFVLFKGRVKSGTFSHEGREVIKDILQPFAVFGDLALAGEKRRSDFAQALYDEVEYFAFKSTDLQQFMQVNQRFMFNCLQHLSQRLQRVEERLSNMILKDARERIIDFLVESAGREGRRVGYETLVKHHLTQQDIANLTGTSRQTVTSVLNDLRKNNLIYFNRSSILIRDVERLA